MMKLNPNLEIGSQSDYSGDGSVKRNEKLTLRVAATVVEVLPNGHLVIQGDQEVRVNYELRDLQITGIVRPEDISRYNEIALRPHRRRAHLLRRPRPAVERAAAALRPAGRRPLHALLRRAR